MNQKLLALYGLKWNPFSPDLPTEAIYVPPRIENFCWRIEQAQIREGGFAMIHGDPGTGKSVALRLLAERLARLPDITVGAINHPQSNLADFYRDAKRYAFATQIYLLNRRFQQHQEIIWRGGGGVQDRTIYEDAVFAKTLVQQGLMDARDYDTYRQLFRHMSNFMCRPNVIVFLDLSPASSMARIQQRSRDVESGISMEYLLALHRAYQDFIHDISRTVPVIRVSWEEYRDPEEMAAVIEREYLQGSFLRDAQWRPTR